MIFVDPASNLHPYDCNGPGHCIHCDKTDTDMHNPNNCLLCDEGKRMADREAIEIANALRSELGEEQ